MASEAVSQVGFIRARSVGVRAALLAVILLALWFGWYAFSREIGNMMAEVTEPTAVNAKATAYAATWMAPSDPLANWLLASTDNDTADPDSAADAVKGFENLVRLSPDDYRWWIQLGRAREQAEDFDGAERALKHSLELAPNYTFPHWQLGNFYLRQGRNDEAFAQLKLTAQNNVFYREQVFYTVWDFFNGDREQLEKIVGNSPQVQATLAKFYSTHQQPEAAVKAWESLSPEDREENNVMGGIIMQTLYERKNFLAASYFAQSTGRNAAAKPGQVTNGGFESPIKNSQAEYPYFDWMTAEKEKVSIKPDASQRHDGKLSLRQTFSSFVSPSILTPSQIVAVEPGGRYSLTFWVKTENLKSGGPPKLEVAEINGSRGFGETAPFPTGTNDWQQFKIDFTVPNDIDGIIIRTARQYCGENCPIIGTVWYDDFNLQKISNGK
jgi:tetratricopeptide (TPR) repeat protein